MLGGEFELVGGWLVDSSGWSSVEDLWPRGAVESFRVRAPGVVQRGVSVTVDGVGQCVVHVGGGVCMPIPVWRW